jgi:hypothetical protein
MMMIDGRSTVGCEGQLTPPSVAFHPFTVITTMIADLSNFGLGFRARRHFVALVPMLLFSFHDDDEDRKEPDVGSKHNARSFSTEPARTRGSFYVVARKRIRTKHQLLETLFKDFNIRNSQGSFVGCCWCGGGSSLNVEHSADTDVGLRPDENQTH